MTAPSAIAHLALLEARGATGRAGSSVPAAASAPASEQVVGGASVGEPVAQDPLEQAGVLLAGTDVVAGEQRAGEARRWS